MSTAPANTNNGIGNTSRYNTPRKPAAQYGYVNTPSIDPYFGIWVDTPTTVIAEAIADSMLAANPLLDRQSCINDVMSGVMNIDVAMQLFQPALSPTFTITKVFDTTSVYSSKYSPRYGRTISLMGTTDTINSATGTPNEIEFAIAPEYLITPASTLFGLKEPLDINPDDYDTVDDEFDTLCEILIERINNGELAGQIRFQAKDIM